MPKPRYQQLAYGASGVPGRFFLCVSRVTNRDFVFGEAERERFAATLRAAETFSGVRVLTWNANKRSANKRTGR